MPYGNSNNKDLDSLNQLGGNGEFVNYVVDPNPRGLAMHEAEDLFIYCELKIIPRSRSVILYDEETRGSIKQNNVRTLSFISTQDTREGEYITTNYTNIGGNGINDEQSKESLGITNIEITHTPSYIPRVSIKFKDLRGASLFDGHEQLSSTNINGRNMRNFTNSSDYGFFFHIPYPMFELTVKGYYGKAVTMCLHLLSWDGTFDSSDGTFNIDCEFAGFEFAYLNDISLSHVAAVNDTSIGNANLRNFNNNITSGQTELISLNEMWRNIGRLDHIAESIKKDNSNFQKLSKLTAAFNKMKSIQNLVSKPYSVSYSSLEQGLNVSTKFMPRQSQIVYRDVLVSTSETADNFKNLLDDYSKQVNDLNNFIQENDISELNPNLRIDNYSFQENVSSDRLLTVINTYQVENDLQPLTSDTIQAYLQKFSGERSRFYNVYNLHKLRENTHKEVVRLTDVKKELERTLNEEINVAIRNKLGFSLTIYDIFRIILGNVDVFMKTIYDVAYNSELYGEERFNIYGHQENNVNSPTDSPSDVNIIYPFPAVYDDTSGIEIYLGDNISGEQLQYFPEVSFMEEVLDSFVSHSKEREDKDSTESKKKSFPKIKVNEDWIPISQLDCGDSEYSFIESEGFQNETLVNDSLISKIYSRYKISKDFSNYSSDYINQNIVLSEANNILKSVVDNRYREELVDRLLQYDNNSLSAQLENINIDLNIKGELINSETQTFYSSKDDKGKTLLSKNKPIQNYKPYILDEKYHENNNNIVPTKDLTYEVWSQEIKTKIRTKYQQSESINYNSSDKLRFPLLSFMDSLYFIEGGNIPINYFEEGDTIRRINTQDASEKSAIEFLNRLGFNTNTFFELIDVGISNIIVPRLFLAYLGSLIKIGVEPIENQNMNDSNKKFFESCFDRWFTSDWLNASESLIYYTNNYSDIPKLDKAIADMLHMFTQTETIVNLGTFSTELNSEVLDSNFINYFNALKTYLSRNLKNDDVVVDNNSYIADQTSVVRDNDFRLGVYRDIKDVYDKWIAGTSTNGRPYNVCSYFNRDNKNTLIDYFHFVDSHFNYIGDKLIINPKILLNLSKNKRLVLGTLIGSICDDSGILFYSMPSKVNVLKTSDIMDMFKPFTTIENPITSPCFFLEYTNSNSKVLDIQTNQYYVNDGFDLREDSITDIPKAMHERTQDPTKSKKNNEPLYALNMFRVAYGDQNQSIFKDLNLSFNNKSNTYESLVAEAELLDNKGATQRYWKGAGVYNVYAVRSYTCEVSCMGNMMIQPMQYFQLDNVPFFHGAYKIESVTHSITPNNVETNFKGRRVSKYSLPVVDSITSYIDIYLDDVTKVTDKIAEQETVKIQEQSPNPQIEIPQDDESSDGTGVDIEPINEPTVVNDDDFEPSDEDLVLIAFDNNGTVIEYVYNG